MANKEIYIGEHLYLTPNIPPKREILFYDKPKHKQFWLRQEFPQLFLDYIPNYTEFEKKMTEYDDDVLLKSLSVEDSKMVYELLLQERDRRVNGIWFMNNGEETYITGSHYFMLQWFKMYAISATNSYEAFKKVFEISITRDEFAKMYSDYGRYFEFQRDIFYLLDICDKDPEIAGIFLTKAKKTGVTMLIAAHILNLATMSKGAWIGIMSKTSDAALETNFIYIYHGLMGTPKALQPMISNLPKASGEISFGASIYRGNNKKQKALAQISQEGALNSKIKCLPTKIKAFDAPVVFRAVVDEPTKIFSDSKISVRQLFDTTLATIKFQQTINGKTYWACYVSEENDEGVDDCRKIFFDSELKTKGSNKRTKSELICHHVSANYSYIDFIDKYGICDEKKANKEISDALEKSKGDPRTYQSMRRQNARSKEEAWGAGGTKSLFNPVALSEAISEIEAEERDTPIYPYQRGYLKWDMPLWEHGKKNRRPKGKISRVIFVPLTEDEILEGGKHKLTIYQHIPYEKTNLPLKLGKDGRGNYIRPHIFDYVGGCDPVNYAGDVIEGSKIASYTMNMHNEGLNSRNGVINSKILVSSYYYRSDNPDENYEDILKELVYFGKLFLVEGNSQYVSEQLIREGFSNYMVLKNKEKVLCLYEQWMTYGEDCFRVIRSANADTDDLFNYMVRVAMGYLEIIPNEPNYLNTIKDMLLLKQLMHMNPKDTQKSDKAMAFMYTLVCHDVYSNYLMEGQDNDFGDVYASILRVLEQ